MYTKRACLQLKYKMYAKRQKSLVLTNYRIVFKQKIITKKIRQEIIRNPRKWINS